MSYDYKKEECMKVFKVNGKYGVKEGNKIIVQPVYTSTRDMVANDSFFTNQVKPPSQANATNFAEK